MKKLLSARHSLSVVGLVLCSLLLAMQFSYAQNLPDTSGNKKLPDVNAPAPKDTSWKHGGFVSVSFSQTGFSNWAAGGQNALALNALFSGFYNYKVEKTSWENSLDLSYGLTQLDKQTIQKNDDRIELNSKYGRLAKGKFFYSALFNFKTQFAPGYNYPDDSTVVSNFLAPAYLTLAFGLDYKPTDYLSIFISPATGKLTIINNQEIADAGTYGNDKAVYDTSGNVITHGKKTRIEFGASLVAKFQKDIFKNVNLLAKLNLFNNYTNPVAANRGNIAVNFEGLLSMKVNKFLSASIASTIIYDNDIMVPLFDTVNGERVKVAEGRRTQIKEVIGIGLAYKF